MTIWRRAVRLLGLGFRHPGGDLAPPDPQPSHSLGNPDVLPEGIRLPSTHQADLGIRIARQCCLWGCPNAETMALVYPGVHTTGSEEHIEQDLHPGMWECRAISMCEQWARAGTSSLHEFLDCCDWTHERHFSDAYRDWAWGSFGTGGCEAHTLLSVLKAWGLYHLDSPPLDQLTQPEEASERNHDKGSHEQDIIAVC